MTGAFTISSNLDIFIVNRIDISDEKTRNKKFKFKVNLLLRLDI